MTVTYDLLQYKGAKNKESQTPRYENVNGMLLIIPRT